MEIIIDELTLDKAYDKYLKVNNRIKLVTELQEIKSEPIKAAQLKDVIVTGGRVNNDGLFKLIIGKGEYAEQLRSLYRERAAYENYILSEIERLELSQPTIVIVFLKDVQKWTWDKISKYLYEYYSDRQIRDFYYDYKNKISNINKIYSCK